MYSFDYIIGSVHFLSGYSIFENNQWDDLSTGQKKSLKALYYYLISQSAKSGVFQVIGHMDALKTVNKDFADIKTSSIDQCLKVIAESKVVIEVNTSGTQKGCGWYPDDDILERALHFGVDVTFGSDAHTPGLVSNQFEKVQAKLKKLVLNNGVMLKRNKKFSYPYNKFSIIKEKANVQLLSQKSHHLMLVMTLLCVIGVFL